MRRFSIANLSLTLLLGGLSSSFSWAQTPDQFQPKPAARIGGVRVSGTQPQQNNSTQQVGYQTPALTNQPIPKAMPSNPMGQPGSPMPMGTQLGSPRELSGTPSITENHQPAQPPTMQPMPMPGTIQGAPSYSMVPGMIVGDGMPMSGMPISGMPMSGMPYGVPVTCDGPFTYLNDAPHGDMACMPGACGTGFAGSMGLPSPTGPIFGGGLLANRPLLHNFVQPGKWYGSAEYLLWYTKNYRLPPLLTTSNANDNGFLGAGSTRTLFGDSAFGNNQRNGGRFNLGYWFGFDQCLGVDATYFILGKQTDTYSIASNGDPLLARPFVNGNTSQQFSQIVAYPGQASGSFTATQTSSLWGGDINLRRFYTGNACRRYDIISGFKYLNLEESLTLRENVTRVNNGFAGINTGVGNAIVQDSFRTNNQFYGYQFGILGERRYGRWYVDGIAKIGLGVMRQTSTINGSQVLTTANGTQNVAGGLLALPEANIGTRSQSRFAVVPDLGINLGYHITPNCRAFVGYNFLYASSVLRPGDQIDTTLDVTRIPNFPNNNARLSQVRPSPTLRDTDYFAQGINIGLQFKW